jgi:hypothetical protein
MKSLNPILHLIVGVLIIVSISSFKSNDPKKEYLTISIGIGKSIIIYPSGETKEVNIRFKTIDTEVTKLLNDLGKENWTLTSTITSPSTVLFILERNIQ